MIFIYFQILKMNIEIDKIKIIFMMELLFAGDTLSIFSDAGIYPRQLVGTLITIMLATAFICFLASEITRNYSQVDKLWSLMPIIYSLVAFSANPSPRLGIMCVLVALWGIRLSFNFYRKGGYNIVPWKGEEDYRWKILRMHPSFKGRFRFSLFNLFFISFYQNLLILLFSSPVILVSKNPVSGIKLIDICAASLMLLFIIIETIADNQQFRFHKLKRQTGKTGALYSESLKNGFLSEGLWSYVETSKFHCRAMCLDQFLFFRCSSDREMD